MEVGSTHPAHPKFVGWERMAKTYHEHNVQLLADLAALRAEVRKAGLKLTRQPDGTPDEVVIVIDYGGVGRMHTTEEFSLAAASNLPAIAAALEEEG
jgi:hypothetical protein